ncbi:MAG: hypothetical protein C4331_16155 [Meiothermus sp.]
MKAWFGVLALGMLGGLVLAQGQTRTVTVNLSNTAGAAVPVSLSLLQLRDAIGAEFATQWTSLRVRSGGTEVPYQIDDLDGNGRISAGDELSFLASGPVTITVSDQAGTAPSYPAALETAPGTDGATVIRSKSQTGFSAEVSKQGLVRITGMSNVRALLADELGNLRMSGFPGSTFWKDKNLGPHEEKTTLDGMILQSLRVLPAGPARVAVVARYASPLWVGLEQMVVSRVYASGAVEVSNTVTFRGYSDMMKLEHQATRLVVEADPDALHIAPLFRRVALADYAKQTPAQYFTERGALKSLGGKSYIAFKATDNLKPSFWGATYIFASPEPWRTNYSAKLQLGVAEVAYGTPPLAPDYNTFVAGNQWQFESQEFRTGIFKWLPDELKSVEATKALFDNPNPWVSHFYPGDSLSWRFLYDVYRAPNAEAAITYLERRAADLASIRLSR